MNEWRQKKCVTCGSEFTGQHFMKQCRKCYWQVKGFAWRCPKQKNLHTPDDIKMLWYGGVVGSGMWSEKDLLMRIECVGGFEQFTHESWDELWRVEILTSCFDSVSPVHHDPPIKTSAPCLICAIKEAVRKAKANEPPRVPLGTTFVPNGS